MVWVFNPLTVSLVSHSDFDEDSPAEWLEIHKIKKKMHVQIKCWNKDHTYWICIQMVVDEMMQVMQETSLE